MGCFENANSFLSLHDLSRSIWIFAITVILHEPLCQKYLTTHFLNSHSNHFAFIHRQTDAHCWKKMWLSVLFTLALLKAHLAAFGVDYFQKLLYFRSHIFFFVMHANAIWYQFLNGIKWDGKVVFFATKATKREVKW